MRLLMIICGILMMSSVVLAEDTTAETCADGAGTVVIGAVSGHKYCKSKIGMNWWNAVSWCDGIGRKLFSLDDCACSNATANCNWIDNNGNETTLKGCPEMNKQQGVAISWTRTASSSYQSYRVGLQSGYVDSQNRGNTILGSSDMTALCY